MSSRRWYTSRFFGGGGGQSGQQGQNYLMVNLVLCPPGKQAASHFLQGLNCSTEQSRAHRTCEWKVQKRQQQLMRVSACVCCVHATPQLTFVSTRELESRLEGAGRLCHVLLLFHLLRCSQVLNERQELRAHTREEHTGSRQSV